MADAAAVRSAVRRLEERLGPVTALVHACAAASPRRFADLTADDIRAQLRSAAGGLASAFAAIRPGRLRLVVTFGWVTGRYGLAGTCHQALASGALREQTQRFARRAPACRVLHVELPAWSVDAGGAVGAGAAGGGRAGRRGRRRRGGRALPGGLRRRR